MSEAALAKKHWLYLGPPGDKKLDVSNWLLYFAT